MEARFAGKGEWYPGIVRAVHVESTSGVGSHLPTITIDYDDGDSEEHVPRVRARLPGQKQPKLLSEGDEVDVKRGKTISLARVVHNCSAEGGRYNLKLLDKSGELVENVPRSAIVALHNWPPSSVTRS